MPARRHWVRQGVLLVAVLAAVSSVAISTAAPRTSLAAAARCRTSGLVLWLDSRGGAAAGSVYYSLKLTNQSGHACSLEGYPGVSAVSLSGRQLGSAAARDRTVAPRVVTLKNGATATAPVQITQALNFPRANCRPAAAAGLRVYPPGETASKVVPFPFQACSSSRARILHVQPVRAGP